MRSLRKKKLDTKAIGLDLWAAFARFTTGKEYLHYGFWTGLEVCASNLGPAQEEYTRRLLTLLPRKPARILDIGGGTGETAVALEGLGHQVEIVVPGTFLAERCRAKVSPRTVVHEMRFEEFQADGKFDVCLFAESFQYMKPDQALGRSLSILAPNGIILIADCFRSDEYANAPQGKRMVGGGSRLSAFRELMDDRGLQLIHEEDITQDVAPSIDLERQLYGLVEYGVSRVDHALRGTFPLRRLALLLVFRVLLGSRGSRKLRQRLSADDRTSEVFCRYNRYMILKIQPGKKS